MADRETGQERAERKYKALTPLSIALILGIISMIVFLIFFTLVVTVFAGKKVALYKDSNDHRPPNREYNANKSKNEKTKSFCAYYCSKLHEMQDNYAAAGNGTRTTPGEIDDSGSDQEGARNDGDRKKNKEVKSLRARNDDDEYVDNDYEQEPKRGRSRRFKRKLNLGKNKTKSSRHETESTELYNLEDILMGKGADIKTAITRRTATLATTVNKNVKYATNVTTSNKTKMKMCPEINVTNPIAFPHIAALLEEVYLDEENELRFVCPVAILTYKWVLAGGKCVQSVDGDFDDIKGLYVRAASNYWSQGGSFHAVRMILYPPTNVEPYMSIVAIKLQEPMPRISQIMPSKIPLRSKFEPMKIAVSYDWPETDMVPLRYREKLGGLEYKYVAMYRDDECLQAISGSGTSNVNETAPSSFTIEDMFCGYEFKSGTKCYYKLGAPIFSDGYLIGIGVNQSCHKDNNVTNYYYDDITRHHQWLKEIVYGNKTDTNESKI